MLNSPDDYHSITGDSKLLAIFSRSGELVRLFWPNVDFGQHVESFQVGITTSKGATPSWLGESTWEHVQQYSDSSNIVVTRSSGPDVAVILTALCLPGQ